MLRGAARKCRLASRARDGKQGRRIWAGLAGRVIRLVLGTSRFVGPGYKDRMTDGMWLSFALQFE